MLVANERNRRATRLRDQGKIEDARQLLLANHRFLGQKAKELKSDLLLQQTTLNRLQAEGLGNLQWSKLRKLMVRDNLAVEQQSPGYGGYGGGGYGGSSTSGGYGAYGYGSGYGSESKPANAAGGYGGGGGGYGGGGGGYGYGGGGYGYGGGGGYGSERRSKANNSRSDQQGVLEGYESYSEQDTQIITSPTPSKRSSEAKDEQ